MPVSKKRPGVPAARRPDNSNETKRLTAEALTTVTLPSEELFIPTLGGTVLIQAFSGKLSRLVREDTVHVMGTDKKCVLCKERSPCVFDQEVDQDLYERKLVQYGVVEPKLNEEQVDVLFEEQYAGIGRLIAIAMLALNANGKASGISKDFGRIMPTGTSLI